MKLVRDKMFNSFLTGREEILNVLPISTIAYFELGSCNCIEETYYRLKNHDVSVKVEQTENGYRFRLIFITENYIHIQRLLTDRDWSIEEDECVGLSQRDIYMMLN